MLYEAALAESRQLSPRCWLSAQVRVGQNGVSRTAVGSGRGLRRGRVMQIAGGWLWAGPLQLDSLVRLVQESFMAVPCVDLLLRGKRAPSSSRGLVVWQGVCI